MKDRRVTGRIRATAVLVALTVHGLLFVGFMVQPRVAAVQRPVAAIDVELVRPMPALHQVHDRPPPIKSIHEPFASSSPALAAPSNGTTAANNRIVVPRNPTTAAIHDQPSIDAGLASTLRSSVGCSSATFLHLSPSERQACERLRQDQRATIGTAEFGLDPSKKALLDEAKNRDAFWDHPFSGIKLLEHCRPHAGTGPAGTSGDATIGLNCTIPF